MAKYLIFLSLFIFSGPSFGDLENIEVSIKEIKEINKTFRPHPTNTHQVSLNLYIPESELNEYQRLEKDLLKAQKKLNDCSITLKIDQKNILKTSPEFLEYESIEFNGGTPSPHEKAFFEITPKHSAGILLVESLDWTIGEDGTVAIAYGPYILDLDLVEDPVDRKFLSEKMVGYSILGRHRSQWTLTHELGHSLFNFQHTDDPRNIMFPYGFARHPNPTFSESQCEKAREWAQIRR